VCIGFTDDGRPMEKNVRLASLIVGAPGAGKSTELWTTLWALRRAGIPFRLWVFDPKGGMELGALEHAAWRYESSPANWPKFLQDLCAELWSRQKAAKVSGDQSVVIDDEHPLDVLGIDEFVTALAMGDAKDRVRAFGKLLTPKKAFLTYMSQQRSGGATTIALSQLGEKVVIGAVRGMFGYMTCLRVAPTEAAQVDMLLGQGGHNLYPAHELVPGPSSAGIGWTRSEHGIENYRPAMLSAEERDELVAWMKADTERRRGRVAA
jgi:hypothetical protein